MKAVFAVCLMFQSAHTMLRPLLSVLLVLLATSFAKYIPKSGKRVPQTLSRGLLASNHSDWVMINGLADWPCPHLSRLGRPADLGSDLWRGSVLVQVQVRSSHFTAESLERTLCKWNVCAAGTSLWWSCSTWRTVLTAKVGGALCV